MDCWQVGRWSRLLFGFFVDFWMEHNPGMGIRWFVLQVVVCFLVPLFVFQQFLGKGTCVKIFGTSLIVPWTKGVKLDPFPL